MNGRPPVWCVSVTWMHSEPPGAMSSGSWLALVLTVNGLVRFVPLAPYVATQVDPAFGTRATNPAQLAVADTPAAIVTSSRVFPVPPFQYIVKVHTPAAT